MEAHPVRAVRHGIPALIIQTPLRRRRSGLLERSVSPRQSRPDSVEPIGENQVSTAERTDNQ